MTTQIPIRIAGAQIPVTQDIEKNVITIKKAIDYAYENKCDYLVTPEGSLSGYDHDSSPFFEFEKLSKSMIEVEEYAKGKVGLCLGTVWLEKERYGFVGRNQIRFYNKEAMLVGVTNKTYGINPQDNGFLEHDMETQGVRNWALGDDTFKFNAVGLVCNDMWGHGWSGGQMIPWAAKQNFNMNGRDDMQLIIHSTNAPRGDECTGPESMFEEWHNAHLKMLSWISEVPIFTVDNCYKMNGEEYHGRTSSESGVVIKGEYVTEIPRTGTQYFYHDFFGIKYEEGTWQELVTEIVPGDGTPAEIIE